MLKCTLSLLLLAAVCATESSEETTNLPRLGRISLQRDDGHVNLQSPTYDIKSRVRREINFPGMKKPTHRDVIIPNWNPNARIKPWQAIGVKTRNRRSIEALSSEERAYQSPVEELASQELKYRSPRSVEALSSQEALYRSPVEELASQELKYRSPGSVEALSSQEVLYRNPVEELASQELKYRSPRSVEALSSQEVLYGSPVEELASQELKYRSPRSVEALSSQEVLYRSPIE